MSFPTGSVPVPDVVARIADGRVVTAVWVNELGGVTFSVGGGILGGDGANREFVKVHPDEHAGLLIAEERRLRWAVDYLAVPRVLSTGPGWLHTAGLPGRSAVDPFWARRPAAAARAIGAGLRGMHDALPVDDCPFGPPSWVTADAPPADRLVVCHGDACAPNTLVADDGECSGHVDLGELGVADRWADLAIATMSLEWNYPDGDWVPLLLDAYGVAPDEDRIAHYRSSWDQ